VIAARILAVLSAMLLVGAVALATFGSRAMTLETALGGLDPGLATGLLGWVQRTAGSWSASHLMQPFLVRPAWLVPAFLGLISLGLAVTLSRRTKASRPQRRGRGSGRG
jgi:hypothetical protein